MPTGKDKTTSSSSSSSLAPVSAAQLRLIWTLLPKIPLVLRVVVLHLLGLSESSRYLDLRSDVIVSVLRSMLGSPRPSPVAKTQALTLQDPGVRGRIWVSTVASGVPPEDGKDGGGGGIREALLAAIDGLEEDNPHHDHDHDHDRLDRKSPERSFAIPDVVPVEAEWTGYRAGATPKSTPPAGLSEADKYGEMMRECRGPATILYFHGGAYYLCDPATHRPLTKKLAKLTGGRVYSVRYRLAPQHPFPAALLDALVSYFTLLYPPPGAVHAAVPPEDIVFGGDSAGGNLALALLQTLLEMRRQGRKVSWFGAAREVPLPAAVTANSPWCDLVQSLPSWATNLKWDYLPAANLLSSSSSSANKRSQQQQPPPDEIWPARPPRRHLYVDDAHMLHPLASVHLARSWRGSPPVYLCCGWECLADEVRYLAARMTMTLAEDPDPKDDEEGGPTPEPETEMTTVVFEEYEAMPHVFASILARRPEARRNLAGWTGFITAVVDDANNKKKKTTTTTTPPLGSSSSFTSIAAKTLQEKELDPARLTPYSERDVREMALTRTRDTAPAEPAPKL
ncbi:Alpha/Beta hydrolase protein [Xylariaceae sp. FL0804]|nr:Alpha/Beta hydrolase protein [Xylariaceae sp. FL0804]